MLHLHSNDYGQCFIKKNNTGVWNLIKSKIQNCFFVTVGPSLTASSPSNNGKCLTSSKICSGVTNLLTLYFECAKIMYFYIFIYLIFFYQVSTCWVEQKNKTNQPKQTKRAWLSPIWNEARQNSFICFFRFNLLLWTAVECSRFLYVLLVPFLDGSQESGAGSSGLCVVGRRGCDKWCELSSTEVWLSQFWY